MTDIIIIHHVGTPVRFILCGENVCSNDFWCNYTTPSRHDRVFLNKAHRDVFKHIVRTHLSPRRRRTPIRGSQYIIINYTPGYRYLRGTVVCAILLYCITILPNIISYCYYYYYYYKIL